jgi:hypothetical protein
MGFDYLRHEIDKLAKDDDYKIATLADAIRRLMDSDES